MRSIEEIRKDYEPCSEHAPSSAPETKNFKDGPSGAKDLKRKLDENISMNDESHITIHNVIHFDIPEDATEEELSQAMDSLAKAVIDHLEGREPNRKDS